MRTSKTVDGVKHTYLYASGKLLRESYGNNTIDFFYDASGNAYALKYNGTTYYYITNLQGDVMSIVDGTGAVVASYEYDPYGNVINAAGDLAEVNPLRYRGYYYDGESGLYYLQSRYYDPEIGRFINADAFASTGQGILGYNMFGYCGNNPIMCKDSTGESLTIAIIMIAGTLVGAATGAFIAASTGGSQADIIEGAVEGAITGLFSTVCGVFMPNALLALACAFEGGMVIDVAVQSASHYLREGDTEFVADENRALETGTTTGLSAAIPGIGKFEKNLVDAIGTAVAWGESSTLIAITDIVIKRIIVSVE